MLCPTTRGLDLVDPCAVLVMSCVFHTPKGNHLARHGDGITTETCSATCASGVMETP